MNYPNGKTTKVMVNKNPIKTKKAQHAHLGIDFEDMLNKSNSYYLENNVAVIYKKPTPVKIAKVDYPSRNRAKITEAYYQIPSTTDYNGLYKGYYIDFEAKSCNGSSFPFGHIYVHQVMHLKKIDEHRGIAFLIILFNDYHEVFLLRAKDLIKAYENQFNGGRKSIPYTFFKEYGLSVKLGFNPIVDYLKAVDILIEEKNDNLR